MILHLVALQIAVYYKFSPFFYPWDIAITTVTGDFEEIRLLLCTTNFC